MLLEKETKIGLLSKKEQNALEISTNPQMNTTTMKENLMKLWSMLNTPVEEKVTQLIELFDQISPYIPPINSTTTMPQTLYPLAPTFVNKYLEIESKLSGRLPITKLLTHKQYLAFKYKNIHSQINSNNPNQDTNTKLLHVLQQELSELNNLLANSIKAYEDEFKESYYTTGTNTNNVTNNNSNEYTQYMEHENSTNNTNNMNNSTNGISKLSLASNISTNLKKSSKLNQNTANSPNLNQNSMNRTSSSPTMLSNSNNSNGGNVGANRLVFNRTTN